jgi:nitrite reductase/ring-hydroxylating ferredoxin subunit/uncharacterized membrane protein
MQGHQLVSKLGTITGFDRVAQPLAKQVHRVYPAGPIKDFLSGTWLGHPLHPALTDVPIGSFFAASLLDILAPTRSNDASRYLIGLGIVAAVPTAAAGAADWSDTYGAEQRIGVVHASSNLAAVALYTASLAARRRGRHGRGVLLGFAGLTALSVGAYLGGHLSFGRGIGVNHAFFEEPPEDWTRVIDDGELAVGRPQRVEAGSATILLYRTPDRIYAIGSRCTHAGGPLEDGDIDAAACTVRCPWHGSVFRLEDGSVVHGPASIPELAYEVRVEAGRVEVRRAQP